MYIVYCIYIYDISSLRVNILLPIFNTHIQYTHLQYVYISYVHYCGQNVI